MAESCDRVYILLIKKNGDRMLKKIVPQTVKAKLLVIIGCSFFLLVGGMVSSTSIEKKKTFLQGEQLQLQAKYDQVQKVFEDSAVEALSMAFVVAETPEVKRLFAEGDREGLFAVTMPMFKNLKEKLQLAQFQFATPPATSFLRLHKPEKFGDDLTSIRQTLVQGNQLKQPVAGLEIGVAGLGLRGVVPVSYEGKHIGVVEFGKDLNDALVKPLKDTLGVDVSVIGPEGSGFKYLAKTHSLTIPEGRYPFLRKIMEQEAVTFEQLHKNGKDLLTAYGPLKDYSGKTIGVLAIPSDISGTVAEIAANLYKLIAGGAVFLLLLLLVLNVIINRLIKNPLRTVIDKFEKAGRGDLTQRMTSNGLKAVNCPDGLEGARLECGCDDEKSNCWETCGSFATEVQCPRLLKNQYRNCRECPDGYQSGVLDEFAELGTCFNAFMRNVRGMVTELQESVQAMAVSSVELSELARGMEEGAATSADRTSSVAAAAEEMSANMNSVAAASEQAATNINMVATATEEMSTTISRIADNTEQASAITRDAVNQAQGASEKVDVLGKAASEISKVTEVISEISEQTNLLALNATIEAARAGEAGKGFAVVANEIKVLAKQTSEATQQIKQQIEGIQSSTGETIEEIREISVVINQVNEIVTTIATAIEEQAATTGEIGGNVVQAAQGISEVNENVAQTSAVSGDIASDIAGVSGVIQEMSSSAGEVNNRAGDLAAIAEKFRELISRFKV